MSKTTTQKRKSSGTPSGQPSKKRKSTTGTPKKSEEQIAEETMKSNRARIAKVPATELTNDAVLAYVTETEPPFIIRSHQLSKRARAAKTQEEVLETLPEGQLLHNDSHNPRLSISYDVHPLNVWEHLRRFKKFTVGDPDRGTDMTAEPGQYILVKNDDTPEDSTLEREQQWKAQVLEIRALDSEHVYIRVAWLNRPVDLEKGNSEHYGKLELIPTNQLDIIDAMTVNGKTTVEHWDEENDDVDAPEEQNFWRHVYDQAVTKQFIPPLRKVCSCLQPINPDQTLVQCASNDCEGWMHLACIAKDAHENRRKDLILESDQPPELRFTREELDQTSTGRYEDRKSVTHVFIRNSDRGHASTIIQSTGDRKDARPVLCLICNAEVP